MEIKKEIVHEVVRGDKHNLRKSANRNAQISAIKSEYRYVRILRSKQASLSMETVM